MKCTVQSPSGKLVTPGFIDHRNHFLGGGGSSGYGSRVPELSVTELVAAGSTVVGCLGMDPTTRTMGALFGKACSLGAEGVSTFIYSGATIEHPIPTLTGSVRTDMLYVDKVVGVGEASLSELGPGFEFYDAGTQYVAKIASEAVLAARLTGKAGLVCLQVPHISKGSRTTF